MTLVERDLVFVLGAGASKEVGLPLGVELKDRLASPLGFTTDEAGNASGDKLLLSTFELDLAQFPHEESGLSAYLGAAEDILRGLPFAISIDNFVHARREEPFVARVAKIAIARAILQAEAQSVLAIGETPAGTDPASVTAPETWFYRFFQRITEDCKFSDLAEQFRRCSIISFNYDRCLEQYLIGALQAYYGMPTGIASRTVAALEILHPYGTIGSLPGRDSENNVPFGCLPDAATLLQCASSIRTFTEGSRHGGSTARIRDVVAGAGRLVFLGFAFHHLNMDLLFGDQPASAPNNRQRVFGTAKGMSHDDSLRVQEEIARRLNIAAGNVHVRIDKTCFQLFHEFARTFSFVSREGVV